MRIASVSIREDIDPGALGYEYETAGPDHVPYLLKGKSETHDRLIAECLGTASAWSYSEADTFARMMHRRGGMPYNETVSVSSRNEGLLVDTTAFITQSKDKKVVVLSFSGTGPVNLIQLLMDANARVDQFWTAGTVHGGFFRAALLLWPTLKRLLQFALNDGSLCIGATSEREKTLEECRLRGGAAPTCVRPKEERSSPSDRRPSLGADDQESLSTLYITGHSLGGALAVLTAALIYRDPTADILWKKLRAIYTFGQPMVGRADFAKGFQDSIGPKLFRHVYRKDLFPSLPSRSAGEFQHIGRELYAAEQGWLHRGTSTQQSPWFVTTMLSGIAAFVLEQLPDVPLLRKLRMRVSLGDHLPINYLRTSTIVPAGSEFL